MKKKPKLLRMNMSLMVQAITISSLMHKLFR